MDIRMTGEDFQRLASTSMSWGSHWAAHDGRFENFTAGKAFDAPCGYDWAMAYWLGECAAGQILAASFLADQGHDYELLWDLDSQEWVLVTDYLSPGWRDAE